MRQTAYIIISVLMTSCATIMNQSHKKITFYTSEPGQIIFANDTIKTFNNKAGISVERKNEPLNVIAHSDSLTKAIEIKPRNSGMYWSNIFFAYGIGMLVDRKNPKRYSYPRSVYINFSDTTRRYLKYRPHYKGEWHLQMSLPHINFFHLAPENEKTKINTGFWGWAIGLHYYHSQNQFLNLSVAEVSDFFLPVPASVDMSGEYELMSSRYMTLSNHYNLKRFTFGYGLSYARNTWDLRYYNRFRAPPPLSEPVQKSSNAFGLFFSTYFKLGEYFNIGAVYRPTFYRPDMIHKFKYEHLASIDFAWKIRLK